MIITFRSLLEKQIQDMLLKKGLFITDIKTIILTFVQSI